MSETALQAYLDRELSSEERAEVEEHLGACEGCTEELDELRAVDVSLRHALHELDRPTPAVEVAVLRERAESEAERGSVVVPLRRQTRRPFLAAALVLIFVAGAGAALPGSPLRDWLERSFGARSDDAVPAVAEEATTGNVATLPGVTVQPSGGAIRILILDAAPETMVRVRLLDRGEPAVWSETGKYRTGPGEIEVRQAGPGELTVELPRLVERATVEIDGRTAVLKDGPEFKFLIPAADSSDTEVAFPVR